MEPARWEWAVPLGVLDALFIAFVAVQATVLFGGHDHVLDTEGLTVVKVHELLERKGVVVPERTLHRYALEELGVGRSVRSIGARVAAMSLSPSASKSPASA